MFHLLVHPVHPEILEEKISILILDIFLLTTATRWSTFTRLSRYARGTWKTWFTSSTFDTYIKRKKNYDN